MNKWIHDSLSGGEHHKENEMLYNYWISKSLPGVIASSFFYSVQFSLVAQLCPTLCNPIDFSRPGLPVYHQLSEFYSNSCQSSWWCHPPISSSVVPFSSHLQSFPASGSFQKSQLFTSGTKVLEFQLQHQSFQWIFRTDFL